MPEQEPTLRFRLPTGETVDAYMVTMKDGRRVVRTADELLELPHRDAALDESLTDREKGEA